MKHLCALILTIMLSTALGQSLEFAVGGSHNLFFDNHEFEQPTPTETSYAGGIGHGARVGINFDLPELSGQNSLSLKVNLGYSTYKADYIMALFTRPSTVYFGSVVSKTTLDLGLYPINILLKDRLQISVGGEINFMLTGTIEEKASLLASLRCPRGLRCTNNGNFTHRPTTVRAVSRFSYLIPLTARLILVPQYQFSMGLIGEFFGTEINTKTLHNSFSVGLQKKLP